MATVYTPPNAMTKASQALSYPQAMDKLAALVEATPSPQGLVVMQANAWTTIQVKAGLHYKVRKPIENPHRLEIPDNLLAVRHGDALHLRYANGSMVNLEGFFSTCTEARICTVQVAGDIPGGITLDGSFATGGVADDGLLVYAHGEHDVLMAMAADQAPLLSALRGLGDVPVLTYLPPLPAWGPVALAGLLLGAALTPGNDSHASAVTNGQTAALNAIRDAAQNNDASSSSIGTDVYRAAGVSGVTTANLSAMNSALNSLAVTGTEADTTPEVQGIVDAYLAILRSADGVADNTVTALASAQYTALGVTGVGGAASPGSTLHLLNNVVDAIPLIGVDTVGELQTLADAAAHVMAGAAGGSGPSVLDLTALGISGVGVANLTYVQTAIANTADDGTAVDTRPELQALVTAAINAIPVTVAHVTSQLAGLANLDVTSNLVLSSDQSLIVGSGFIHITDLGGAGYRADTSTNTQNMDVTAALATGLLSVVGSGANTRIVINPVWDLDLASNYQISIDDGAFLHASVGGSIVATPIASINFSTVTPGTHSAGNAASEAAASQTMVNATGALAAGKSWLDIQGIGSNTGSVTQLGDLSGGAFALVMKNYATSRGGDPATGGDTSDGIATRDTNVGFLNFGTNDLVYFDSQANNLGIQFFDPRYTGMTDGLNVGGLAGQNTLVLGLVPTPQQSGSTAMVLLGLEGNTSKTIYPSVVTLNPSTVGWADVWHIGSAPVVMG
jgi:hypothetical protein